MKIAIITNSHNVNDARIYYKIAKTISKEHNVTIASPRIEANAIKEDGIEFYKLRKENKIKQLKQVYRYIKSENLDTIIVIEPLLFLPAILANFTSLRKKRIVYDCHEFYALAAAENKNPLIKPFVYFAYKMIEDFFVQFAETIFTVNTIHKARFHKHKNVIIIPNYPVENHFEDKAKKYDFLYIGGISFERGLKKVLNAIYAVSQKRDIKVLFIGTFLNEESKEYFHNFVETKKVKKRIKYLPSIPHKRIGNYLARTKFGLSVLNPKTERYQYALPLKVPEYLQAGVPVLTNNFPLTKDVVQTFQCGFVTEYNQKAIENKMIQMMDLTEDEYTSLAENAKRAVNEKYHWKWIEKPLLKSFEEERKNMLYLSYFYPPLGGPGVQRPLKMIQTFTKKRWNVDVVTVKDIVFHSFDDELAKEDAAKTVFRTKSFDPMSILFHFKQLKKCRKRKSSAVLTKKSLYFSMPERIKKIIRNSFFIDDKLGWFPFAFCRSALQLVKKDYHAIFATIGPYTSGVIAVSLAKIFKKNLYIDYRDHWTMNPYLGFLTPLHRMISEKLEKVMLEQANKVFVISKTMKKDLIRKFGSMLQNKIFVAYNGYDEKDFQDIIPNPSSKRIFRYVGNFYGNRTPVYLLKALAQLAAEKSIPEEVVFSFVGNYSEAHLRLMKQPKLEKFIEVKAQVSHPQAVQLMMDSEVLLLFIATPKGRGVLTGKIFEYLRSNKEILCMIPNGGEAAELLTELDYNLQAKMEDVEAIKKHLQTLFQMKNVRKKNECSEFTREAQSKKIIDEIEKNIR